MSHATGIIFSQEHPPKILAYFEYDGTADLCLSRLYASNEELHDNWRTDDCWRKCSCGQAPAPAWIYSSYGRGFHWAGSVCLTCHAITSELSREVLDEDDAFETVDGLPADAPP